MVVNALILSAITITGCLIVYSKLPQKIRTYVEKYSLITDGLSLLFLYYFLGGTLVALLASAVSGLVISILLYIASHKNQYPEIVKFFAIAQQYLDNMLGMLNTLLKGMQNNGLKSSAAFSGT